jgi:hypothetical protein
VNTQKNTTTKPTEKMPEQLTDLEIAMKLEEISRGEKYQANRMYSEEEVLQLLLRLQQTESYDNLYDWFEQYKKK